MLRLMNRTDRLYALVEELRAVAPRPRSARRLADHFEVSTRTIERDLAVGVRRRPGNRRPQSVDEQASYPQVSLVPS